MSFSFSKALLEWFDKYGRHDLPWQHPRSPYRVWLSEIMLQQTQVATVIPYFGRFLKSFPDVIALAHASQDEVLAHWAGLGYYSRARNLHKAAKIIVEKFNAEIPNDVEALQQLPGIGRSTAGAIVAQAFGSFGVILDGNVRRVLCRFHAVHGNVNQKDINQILWQLATEHTPQKNIVEYTQAIMDLGATICTRQKPQCLICPLQQACLAYQRGETAILPTRLVRKALPMRERYFALLISQKEIFLQRNSFDNIWQGLWNLPNDEDKNNLLAMLNVQEGKLQELSSFRHTFSHFHLTIKPLLIMLDRANVVADNTAEQWVSFNSLDKYGLPAPVKKLIENVIGRVA